MTRALGLSIAILNVILAASLNNWGLLVVAGVLFCIAAPPVIPKYPSRPRSTPESQLKSWEDALRVEFYADDITVEEFEADYWRYLLMYNGKKARRADPTASHTEYPVLGCGCQACSEVNEPFEHAIVGRRLG